MGKNRDNSLNYQYIVLIISPVELVNQNLHKSIHWVTNEIHTNMGKMLNRQYVASENQGLKNNRKNDPESEGKFVLI